MTSAEARAGLAVATLALALTTSGCVERIMLGGMIRNVKHTEGGIETVHDFELARQMSESSIGQLEGLYRLAPDDADVHGMLTRAWAALGERFLLDAYESARARGDSRAAVYQRVRMRAAFARARFYAGRALADVDDGFEDAIRDPAALGRWLEGETDAAEHAPLLLWAGIAWMGHALSSDAPDETAIAVGRALLERSLALDETVEHAEAHVFLAMHLAARGDPDARGHAARARTLTGGRSLGAVLGAAVADACQGGAVATYRRALDAVLAANDPLPDARLQNLTAQRRARRYRDAPAFRGCPRPFGPVTASAPAPARPASDAAASR
jgi:hypothetical protein